MKLLLLDFEATDKDPKTARITQFCFKGLDLATGESHIATGYVWDPSYPPQSAEVIAITRITDEILRTQGRPPLEMLQALVLSAPAFDFCVAHNANEYDRVLLEAEAQRHGVTLPQIAWMDTRTDLPYPERQRCRVLSHVALDHGIQVDPSILHGALADVELMEKLLLIYKDQLAAVGKISQAPFVAIFAKVGYEGRELAKKEAYRWSPDTIRPDNGKKGAWVKKVRDFQVDDEIGRAALAGFKIQVLPEKINAKS